MKQWILKHIRRRRKHCYSCGTKIKDVLQSLDIDGGVAHIYGYGWGYVCISCLLSTIHPSASTYEY